MFHYYCTLIQKSNCWSPSHSLPYPPSPPPPKIHSDQIQLNAKYLIKVARHGTKLFYAFQCFQCWILNVTIKGSNFSYFDVHQFSRRQNREISKVSQPECVFFHSKLHMHEAAVIKNKMKLKKANFSLTIFLLTWREFRSPHLLTVI